MTPATTEERPPFSQDCAEDDCQTRHRLIYLKDHRRRRCVGLFFSSIICLCCQIEMATFAPGPSGTNVPPADPLSLVGIRNNLGEEGDDDDESETTTTTTSYTRPHTVSPTSSVISSSLEAFSNCFQCVSGFFAVPFLNILLGRRRNSAHWVGIRSEGTDFVSRFGYLFEDYRGPPVIRE